MSGVAAFQVYGLLQGAALPYGLYGAGLGVAVLLAVAGVVLGRHKGGVEANESSTGGAAGGGHFEKKESFETISGA